MTTITDAPPWTIADVRTAHELSDSLTLLGNMILARPDTAPLLADMFRNLIDAVPSVEDVNLLAEAAATNGGVVAEAKHTGLDVDFGRRVRIWVMTGVPPEPVPAVVDVPPAPVPVVAHDEVPDVEPDDTTTDDAETPVETEPAVVDLDATQAYEVTAS